MSDAFRNWLIGKIAGRRFAFWIADDAAKDCEALMSIPGGAGAILLARAVREMDATNVEFTLSDCTITVRRAPAQDGDQ